ncbi:MAG: GNAT family N-acetyltransferase [Polyangiaceae bacterium]|nr:GNAT family N-acetyltransferase [Polyangiaceae bacterium]
MSACELRRATAADAGRILEIARACGLVIDVEAELARPHGRLWVGAARPGEEVAAVLSAWRVADELHVLDLGTAPGARRRGLAAALVARALEEAASEAAACAVLEVRATNSAARALYAKFGFTVARERSRYYDDGEDALEMVLWFDPRPPHSAPAEGAP